MPFIVSTSRTIIANVAIGTYKRKIDFGAAGFTFDFPKESVLKFIVPNISIAGKINLWYETYLPNGTVDTQIFLLQNYELAAGEAIPIEIGFVNVISNTMLYFKAQDMAGNYISGVCTFYYF